MANGGNTAAAGVERQRREMVDQLAKIERLAIYIIVILISCSLLYSAGIALSKCSFPDFLRIALLFVALIVSAAVVGGLLGFLFGIPKLGIAIPVDATAAAKSDEATNRGFFRGNTNLEEISDWLTKIIVGVGLVEAKNIYDQAGILAVNFQKTVLPDVAGGPALSGSAAFLIFGLAALVLGFLFVNLETRTRITMLLEDTETARRGPTDEAVNASNAAPITEVDLTGSPQQSAAETAPPSSGDEDLRKLKYEDLKTAAQFAAWGAAQARARNFVAAARALNEAITREPTNVNYILKLAEVRQAQGDERGALVLLEEVLNKSQISDPEILKRVLLNGLYLTPPESFRTAISIIGKLENIPGAADNPSVQLWAAAAYGQQYLWLKQNGGSEAELKEARDKAHAAVKRVVELSSAADSAPRAYLRRLFDPARENSPPNDNDLEIFKDDSEFRALVYKDMTP